MTDNCLNKGGPILVRERGTQSRRTDGQTFPMATTAVPTLERAFNLDTSGNFLFLSKDGGLCTE